MEVHSTQSHETTYQYTYTAQHDLGCSMQAVVKQRTWLHQRTIGHGYLVGVYISVGGVGGKKVLKGLKFTQVYVPNMRMHCLDRVCVSVYRLVWVRLDKCNQFRMLETPVHSNK
jgi:hypothetical protein